MTSPGAGWRAFAAETLDRALTQSPALAAGARWLLGRRAGDSLVPLWTAAADPEPRADPLPAVPDWAAGPWRDLGPGVEVVVEPSAAAAGLFDHDGSLFGALAVLAPEAGERARILRVLADRLAAGLAPARQDEAGARERDAVAADGELDPDSGLGGAAYWRRLLAAEDDRCRALEHPATVLLTAPVARKDFGWLAAAVAAARRTCRDRDVLARPAPGHLAILAVECPAAAAGTVAARLRSVWLDAGVAAVTGVASRKPFTDLAAAADMAATRLRTGLAGSEPLRL